MTVIFNRKVKFAMKKIVSLVIAAMLLLCMTGTALAYDEEITWQGIPWGSSADDVIEKIYELGLVEEGKELSLEKSLGLETPMAADGNMLIIYGEKSEEAVYSIWIKEPNLAIGGNEVAEIAFQFAANDEKSELICVTMRMSDRSDKPYEDIVKLLKEKYGKGKKDRTFGLGDPCMIYLGANDTAVTMHRNGMADYNILQYGKTNGLDILLTYLNPVSEEHVERTNMGV